MRKGKTSHADFLVVVTKREAEGETDEDAWEGTVNTIKNSIKVHSEELRDSMCRHIDTLEDRIEVNHIKQIN